MADGKLVYEGSGNAEEGERTEEEREAAREHLRETIRKFMQVQEEERRGPALWKCYTAAREAHVTYTQSPVPGFIAFELDTDIELFLWRKVIHAGVYFLKGGEEAAKALVYTFSIDEEAFRQIVQEHPGEEVAREDGTTWRAVREEVSIPARMEPLEIQEGRYLPYTELNAWIAINEAETEEAKAALLNASYSRVEVKEPKPQAGEEVAIAQYPLAEVYQNHALAAKAIDGMLEIAFGAPYSELKPRGKSKSKEQYKLTASENACSQFFENGGNAEVMKLTLETVHTLVTDKRAEGFITGGRIWFTVHTILREMLRTTGGTVRARDAELNVRTIDNALWAASSTQLVGAKPDGSPLNVGYLINAERREALEYKGNTYSAVWGFMVNTQTLNGYAENELRQFWRYPVLPPLPTAKDKKRKALTLDQATIERYLRECLHEARANLYTEGGHQRKSKKTVVKRSWEEIFKHFHPLGAMDSRQKRKLIGDFQAALATLAVMDAHDKLHPGRPLYIRAYSEREAGRGRGKGTWVNLIIECTSTLRTPQIDLLGD